jgi:hypothetical protein
VAKLDWGHATITRPKMPLHPEDVEDAHPKALSAFSVFAILRWRQWPPSLCQAAPSVVDCFKRIVAAELEMLEVKCQMDM